MLNQRGDGKKKSLKRRVKIIPFPNQDIRSTQTQVKPEKKIPAKQFIPQYQNQPKVAAQPTGQLRSSSVSIKKMMNPETDSESQVNLRDMPYEAYSFDDVKMAWHSFAYEITG